MIITNSRYALVGYFITSYPTWAHGIIVIYYLGTTEREGLVGLQPYHVSAWSDILAADDLDNL